MGWVSVLRDIFFVVFTAFVLSYFAKRLHLGEYNTTVPLGILVGILALIPLGVALGEGFVPFARMVAAMAVLCIICIVFLSIVGF